VVVGFSRNGQGGRNKRHTWKPGFRGQKLCTGRETKKKPRVVIPSERNPVGGLKKNKVRIAILWSTRSDELANTRWKCITLELRFEKSYKNQRVKKKNLYVIGKPVLPVTSIDTGWSSLTFNTH